MNLASMMTSLQRYGFDTTDPLSTWLNAAMHDFEASFDWPFLEAGPTVVVVAGGSNTIVLPSDATKIITVRDKDNLYKLSYWNRHRFTRDIQDQTDAGKAEVYTLIGTTQVQIWRVPTVATNFEVVYQASAVDMVNRTDVPSTAEQVFPTMCHWPIVVRAASIALMSENEEDRAKTAQSEYESLLLRLMGRFGERELDEVETVQDAQGYNDNSPRSFIGR